MENKNKNFVPIINLMLCIPKIDDHLKILTDEEVKDLIAINFSEYLKSIRSEQNLVKLVNHFISF